MTPLNPFFPILIYSVAFLSAYIIRLKFKVNAAPSRNESIDGLRGFLAFGVFIHHTSIWHQFIQTEEWAVPKSNLYVHFGQTSVALFFMITSFLFITKLINASEKGFDWKVFFISRFYRLAPMYLVSILIVLIIIAGVAHFQLNTSIPELLASVTNWLLFTINGAPLINNYANTLVVDAAVVWSLPYEWLFYFSLPLISLFILKIKPGLVYIIVGLLFIFYFYWNHGINEYHIYSFIGGAIAPVLIKFNVFKKINDTYISILMIVCLALIVRFNSILEIKCIALITVVFTCIALGGTFFGILKNSTTKFLGEICYSTYLMHGIILFVLFYFGFGLETAKELTPVEYCLVILCITPVVVVVSFLGFRFIEKPFMDKAKGMFQQKNFIPPN